MNKKLEYIGNYKVLNQVGKALFMGYAVGSTITDRVVDATTSYRLWTVFTNEQYDGLMFAFDGTRMYEVRPAGIVIEIVDFKDEASYVQSFGYVGKAAVDVTKDPKQAYKFPNADLARRIVEAYVKPWAEATEVLYTVNLRSFTKTISNED